jgi:hypothetical protein
MSCQSCASLNEREFTTEMMVRASGIDNPGVLACPKIAVCMDCGSSRFTMYDADLQDLRDGIAAAA